MKLSGGIWHNEFGYSRVDTGRREDGKAVFEFTLNTDNPMALQVGEHCFVQPDRHGYSNGGNVPWIAQCVISEDLHYPSWILHDAACRERKLYFSSHISGPFTECPVSSEQACRIMGMGLYAAGYTKRAYIAYAFVHAFGPHWKIKAGVRPCCDV